MKDRKVVIENLRKALFHIAHYGYSDDKIVRDAMEEAGVAIKDAIEFIDGRKEEDEG